MSEQDDTTVINRVDEIKVYENHDGEVVVWQESQSGDPMFVAIPKQYAETVARAIVDIAVGDE